MRYALIKEQILSEENTASHFQGLNLLMRQNISVQTSLASDVLPLDCSVNMWNFVERR